MTGEDTAVFVSLKNESALVVAAPRSMPITPCTSYTEEAPAVCVTGYSVRLYALLVTVPGLADDVIVARLTTVPLPQPDTVHSLAFRLIVATDAAGVV